MSHTLDGIGERLNPHHIKAQVRENIREATSEVKHNIREATIGRAEHMARNAAVRVTDTRRGIADALRDNPIPAAMVGIGLGWLLYNGRRSESYGETEIIYQPRSDGFTPQDEHAGMYNEPGKLDRAAEWAGQATGGVRDRAQDLTGRAQESVSDIAGRTREATGEVVGRTTEVIGDAAARARSAAGSLAQQTRSQAGRIEHRLQDAIVESPLVIGAAAIALGLTAGLAVPSTRRESELMGSQRDQLFDRARGIAEETTGKVQQVAQRVVEEAQSSAQEAIQTLQSNVKEAAQDLKTTAREAAQEQGLTGSAGGSTGAQAAGPGTGTGGQTGASQNTGGQGGSTGFGASQTGSSGLGASQTGGSQTGGTQTGTGAFAPGGPEGGSIADPRRM
ncbi:MAG: hypothetical protein KY464_05555, partial [Gemmatimonadetes bacterium]|nr:hypothetical protein [Gemmatimonadota bacterium]